MSISAQDRRVARILLREGHKFYFFVIIKYLIQVRSQDFAKVGKRGQQPDFSKSIIEMLLLG